MLAGALLGLAVLALLILLAVERSGDAAADSDGADAAAPGAALLDAAAGPSASVSPQRTTAELAPAEAAAAGGAAPPSGIRVLDGEGRPLPGAGAVFGSPGPVLRADAAGWIAVDPRLRLETVGLVAAAGFRPQVIQWRAGTQEVALQPDDGIALRVIWADTRQAVAGAPIRRRVPRGAVRHAGSADADWLELALDALLPPVVETDGAGAAFIQLVRLPGPEYVLLEVHAQGAPMRLVHLLAEAERDYVHDRLLPLTLELQRAPAESFRVVDAAGAPLAGLAVTILTRGVPYGARSDAYGMVQVPHAPMSAHGADAIEVELGGECFWRATRTRESVLICAFRSLRGQVAQPESGRWSVASAHGVPGAAGPSAPQPAPWSRLAWRAVAPDGTFLLDAGWQGDPACVLLRDHASGLVVAQAPAHPGVPVLLQPPRACRLHLSLAPGAQALDFRAQFLPLPQDGRDAAAEPPGAACTVELAHLPADLRLPFGRYRVDLLSPQARHKVLDLDLQRDESWLEIAPPAPRRVRGSVRGQISGPLAGARLVCQDEHGRELQSARSGGDGSFAIELYRDGPFQVQVFWPALRGQWWLDNEPAHSASLRADESERALDFVLEEARIRAHKDPADVLLAHPDVYFYLLRWDGAAERVSSRTIIEELSDGRHAEAELIVPPGRYAVSWDLRDSERNRSPILALAAGETRELWLRARDVGRLELHVRAPQGTRYFPEWRCADASGAEQWSEEGWLFDFGADPAPQWMPYFLPPGDYELRLGGTLQSDGLQPLTLQPASAPFSVHDGASTTLDVEVTGGGEVLIRRSR